MKILINCSGNLQGGGLQVAFSFIKECVNFSEHEYYVILGKSITHLVERKSFPGNFLFIDIPNTRWYNRSRQLSAIEKKYNIDVVFTVFAPAYWRPKCLHIAGFALGHYIYPESPYWDTISIKDKFVNSLRKFIHLQYLKKDVDVFICETEDATKRLANLVKDKDYYTVSNTFGSHFITPSFNLKITNLVDISNKFVITSICNYYKHKNLDILKDVSDILQKKNINVVFILTVDESIYRLKFDKKYSSRIVNIGSIKPKDCPAIYRTSNAVIVPSLLECFTANFPEAMIMERPILASDLDFSRTICKDAALYFNPTDAEDIANTIQELIKNRNLQHELVELGIKRVNEFPSPTERTRMYLNICETEYKKRNNVTI